MRSPAFSVVPALAVAFLALLPLSASAANPYTVNAETDNGTFETGVGSGLSGDLRWCIVRAANDPGSTISIPNGYTITLTKPMYPVFRATTITSVSATPPFATIDGNQNRIFFVDSAGNTIVLRNLIIKNGSATGGNGGPAAGGGMGAGGAVFVYQGDVRAENCTFDNNRAIGGRGGDGTGTVFKGGGGGGGLGGNGGSTGSGGSTRSGGGGGWAGAGGGATSGNGASGGGGLFGNGGIGFDMRAGGGGGGTGNGGNGAGTVSGAAGSGGGGRGFGSSPLVPADNGGQFGGGGGGGLVGSSSSKGGNGGPYGGGGGAPDVNQTPSSGGTAGVFGGGGGGNGTNAAGAGNLGGGGGGAGAQGTGATPGNGGYGGGGGGGPTAAKRGIGGSFAGNGGYGNGGVNAAGPGGGGAALGGAVFVYPLADVSGANFEAVDCTFTNNQTTAGLAGPDTDNQVSFPQVSAQPGTAAGSTFFFGSSRLRLSTNSTFTYTLGSDLAVDPAGGIPILQTGGTGTLTLAGSISLPGGGLRVVSGTLRLANSAVVPITSSLTVNDGAFDLFGQNLGFGVLGGTTLGRIRNNGAGAAALTVGNGTSASFNAGAILTDGTAPLGLSKVGPGTLTLSGNHTYTGPTNVSGTGSLVTSLTSGSGPVIAAGSTLTVDGSTVRFTGTQFNAVLGSPVVLRNGGVLSAENTSNNAHTLGALSFVNGGRLSGANPHANFGNYVLNAAGVTTSGEGTALIDASEIQLAPNTIFNVGIGGGGTFLRITSVIRNTNSGAIVGSLIKNGFGQLILTSANTFSGGTTVNAGTLTASSTDGSLGTLGAGPVTVNGGTLQANGNNSLFGTAPGAAIVLRLNAGGMAVGLGASAGHLGPVVFDGGTLSAESPNNTFGNWLLDRGVSSGGSGNTSYLSGGLAVLSQSGGTEFNLVAAGDVLDVSATLPALSSTGLRKTGPGVLILRGNNAYTGGTQLNAGIVSVGHANALGTSGTLAFNGGTLRLENLAVDLSARFSAAPAGGAIRFDTNGQNVAFGTALGGLGGLVKSGAGTLTLNLANTYAGGTTLAGGVLAISHANALGTSGGLTFSGGTLRYVGIAPDLSARIQPIATGQAMWLDTNGQDVTYNSAISGAGGVTKEGAGSLTLAGNNSYTGPTTLSGGTFRFTHAQAAGNGGSLVFQGGLLQFANVAPDVSARIAPVAAGQMIQLELPAGLDLVLASPLSGAGGLSLRGSSAYYLSGDSSFSGPVEIRTPVGLRHANGLGVGGPITLYNGSLLFFDGVAPDLSPRLGPTSESTTFDTGGQEVVFSAPLTFSGTLTKIGAGGLSLGAASTFGGGLQLNGGALGLGHANALGAGPVRFGGGVLRFDGVTTDVSALLAPMVSAAETVALDTNGQTVTFANAISGPGRLAKQGTGILRLTTANTHANGTELRGGILSITTVDALGAGPIFFFGGTLRFEGIAPDLSARFQSSLISLDTNGQDITLATPLNFASTLTKAGAGVLTVQAPSGLRQQVTVQGGTLALAGSMMVRNLTVQSGGTLSVSSAGLNLNNFGAVVNEGVIRLTGGGNLLASNASSFYNNGVLDLSDAGTGTTLPTNFTQGPNSVIIGRGGLRLAVAPGGLGTARTQHTATLLHDGRILVVGGTGSGGNPAPRTTAEIYDPITGTSTPVAASLTHPRNNHSAALLPSGKVIVFGGGILVPEIFDPASGTWSLASTGNSGTPVLLPTGRVLLVASGNSSLYDPVSNIWTPTNGLPGIGSFSTAVLLPTGQVLSVNGTTARLYDPATNNWSTRNNPVRSRTFATLSLLADGRVLLAGDATEAEIFQPTNNSWTLTGAIGLTLNRSSAVRLPSGRLAVTNGFVSQYEPASNTWNATTVVLKQRREHTTTLLPDGRAVHLGGVNEFGTALATAEFATELASVASWAAAAAPAGAHAGGTSATLSSGQILLTGSGSSSNAVELYDPATGLWSATGNLLNARIAPLLAALPDGTALLFGGGVGQVEKYQPAGGTWSQVGNSFVPRRGGTATRLNNGRILLVGGTLGGPPIGNAEQYDPTGNQALGSPSLQNARTGHTATLLADGRVLIAGGHAISELYQTNNSWTQTAAITSRSGATATRLANGQVLFVGGSTGAASALVDLFDPATGLWTAAAPLQTARSLHTASLLPDGNVLVVGGQGASGTVTTAEIYDWATGTWSTSTLTPPSAQQGHFTARLSDERIYHFGGSPTPAGQIFTPTGAVATPRPVIGTAPASLLTGDYLTLGGTGFTGTHGAGSGNVQDSSGAVPLVRLTSLVDGQSRYLTPRTGTNWSSTAFTTGRITGLPTGPAAVTVIANGVPSVPVALQLLPGTAPAFTSATSAFAVAGQPINFQVAFTGAPAADFSFTGTLPAGVTLSANGLLSGTPPADVFVDFPLTFTLRNGNAPDATQNFLLVFNRRPVAGNYQGTTLRDAPLTILGSQIGALATDAEGEAVTVTEVSGSGVSLVNGTITFQPAPGFTGVATFGYTLSDPHGATATGTGQVTVLAPAPGEFGAGSLVTDAAAPGNAAAALLQDGTVLLLRGSLARRFDFRTGTAVAAAAPPGGMTDWILTLLTNGRVLAVGWNGSANAAAIFDPATGSWTATASPLVVRRNFVCLRLANGRVVVIGGRDSLNNALGSTETYDPNTGLWTGSGSLLTARSDVSAVRLADGRILVVGGLGSVALTSAEIYNPSGSFSSPAGNMSLARVRPSLGLLPDGRVLVAGTSNASPLAQTEIYHPGNGLWSTTGSLQQARQESALVVLPNGTPMLFGGHNGASMTSLEAYNATTGTWRLAGSLALARNTFPAVLLPTGDVLLAYGASGGVSTPTLEIFHPVPLLQQAAAEAPVARHDAAIGLAGDGRVLVASGSTSPGGSPVASSQVYDPGTNLWTTAVMPQSRRNATMVSVNGGLALIGGRDDAGLNPFLVFFFNSSSNWVLQTGLQTPREFATATVLSHGRLLVVGGQGESGALASAELILTAAPVFTGSLAQARARHTATLLPDGRVLVTGGLAGGAPLASVEIYDPETGLWNTLAPLAAARQQHTATLLPTGAVLVTGGLGNSGPVATAELFHPETNTWTPAGSLATARFAHAAAVLPGGKLLVAGGWTDAAATQPTASAELFDPLFSAWLRAPALLTSRAGHAATVLANDSILVAGGLGAGGLPVTATEIYTEALTVDPARQPLLSTAPSSVPSELNFTVTGQRFAGAPAGTAATNLAASTDYPLLQFRSWSNGQVRYAPPTAWSDTNMGSMNLHFMPSGPGTMRIIANGLPSAPRIVTVQNPTAPVFLSPENFVATAGQPFGFNVSASGTPAITFSVVSGTLPPGATLAASGFLSGNVAAAQAGLHALVLKAQNGLNSSSTQNFTLRINRQPTPAADQAGAVANVPLELSAELLQNDSDPDNDAISLLSVSAGSSAGGQVSLADGVIRYVPPLDYVGIDQFTYTVQDIYGAPATATVEVTVQPGLAPSTNLLALTDEPGVGVRLRWRGISGRSYTVEYVDALGGTWQVLAGSVSASAGALEFVDPTMPRPPQRFYRNRLNP